MSAEAYARDLLRDLGSDIEPVGATNDHPALAWAASGLMHVTGAAAGPGLMCPVPVAACADGALAALTAIVPTGRLQGLRGATLLGQRARLLQLHRAGSISPGGACRLLQARDGWLAVSLVRPEDWNCVPAWLQQDVEPAWDSVARAIADHNVAQLIAHARELGLAVAHADAPASTCPPQWIDIVQYGESRKSPASIPRVVDMSTLWAGPLCGSLLRHAGADVIKVESASRADGARRGHGGFFDFLNGGKANVALDLHHSSGVAALRQLLLSADIVIESARPRALRQMGIAADQILAARPGRTWVSITGHGRGNPEGDWVGFGDDAAAAGGFTRAMHAAHGHMMFCGDALADPLTGLHAALAAWETWRQGGGKLLSLSLSGVSSHCVNTVNGVDLPARAQDWDSYVQRSPPHMLPLPQPVARARALGADTRGILAACLPL